MSHVLAFKVLTLRLLHLNILTFISQYRCSLFDSRTQAAILARATTGWRCERFASSVAIPILCGLQASTCRNKSL